MIEITENRPEMNKIIFEMRSVEEKRVKKYTTKSMYDPIIDQFLESGEKLVEVMVEDKNAGYVAGQLKKRIETRELEIEASAAQGFVYLEMKPTESA